MKRAMQFSLLALGLFTLPVLAHQAGDIIVRVGAATVAPNESSPVVADVAEFSVNNNTQLGLNINYMITDNIGIELLTATPFSHKISVGELGQIAETQHLPPTLLGQYYFGSASSKLRPYVGMGVNYTNFFDNEFTNDLSGALTNLSMSNSWGWAAHVGLDYQVNQDWLVNGSVWYADIATDVKFNLGDASQDIKTDIDPWVYMFSVGYSF